MDALIAATLFLVASHAVPAHPGLRARVIDRFGVPGFRAVHSLLSVAALAAVILAYRAAEPGLWLWYPAFEDRHLTLAAMPLAMILLVCRFTERPAGARGIYRITATPGSLAVLVWSLAHLVVMGDQRRVVLFAGMLAIALVSLARNAAARPAGVAAALPFLRILRGDDRIGAALAEIGWWRPALGLLLYGAALALHPLVFGVDPLAGVLG